jgi:hypothetical protein
MTQGTIFTCATAADYVGCATFGIILTARCDIAHDKVRVHNYLPVVKLDDWLHRDGRVILGQRAIADATASMKGVLKEGNRSPAILETELPRTILEALFPSSSDKKLRERFERACVRLELAQRCCASQPDENMIIKLATEVPRLRDALITELVHNNLNGFYFLNSVEPNDPSHGYVVLVREVQTIPRDLSHAVSEGLDRHTHEHLCNSDPSLANKLIVGDDDYACPIGQIQSPHLEHLLQTFSILFSRIGLPDPDKQYVNALWEKQPTVTRGSEL